MTADAVVARAQALADAGRAHQALPIIVSCLAQDPDDVRAWCVAAQCHLELQDYPSAVTAASRALALAPDHEWPHRLASMALVRSGEYPTALREADEAVRIEPHEWRTHQQRAEVDAEIGFVDDRSWAAAREALELAPHEPNAHVTVGRVALAAGQDRQAARHFREALRLDPNSATAQNNLAVALLRRRRLLRAGSLLSGALRMRPDSALYARNLRVVLSAWALLVNLVSTLGCIVALHVTADDTVSVPGTQFGDPGSTISLGPGAAIVLPEMSLDLPGTTRAVPVTGHPGALTGTAIVLVALLLAIVVAVRRSVGRPAVRVVARLLRTHLMLLLILACSVIEVGIIVAAAAVGMPLARALALTALVVSLCDVVLVRVFRRRATAAYRSR